MPFRDILKKKEKPAPLEEPLHPPFSEVPEFTFLRTTTNLQEEIQPPSYPEDNLPIPVTPTKEKESRSLFHRSPKKDKDTPKKVTPKSNYTDEKLGTPPSSPRRLSGRLEKLHLGRARSASATSVHVPTDLPDIPLSGLNAEAVEAEWEKRATLLAQEGSRSRSTSLASARRSGEDKCRTGDSKVMVENDVRIWVLTKRVRRSWHH